MTIFYDLYDNLYVNITNRCPCSCDFCIRANGDTIKDSDSLWLDREPTVAEICADFDRWQAKPEFSKFQSIVFCGYGEPLERIDDVVAVSRYLRKKCSLPIRINTNGLADLIHGQSVSKKLEGLIDTVSISLNASNAKKYEKLCHPIFGKDAFVGILQFAAEAKKYIPNVIFTVVDTISPEEIEACRKIAEDLQITYRVRTYIDQY